jgi:hypothetical protein
LRDIGNRVYCCLLMHNMNVTERIMGNVRLDYKANNVVEREINASTPTAGPVQLVAFDEIQPTIGIANADPLVRTYIQKTASQSERFENHARLKCKQENGRLMNALIQYVSKHNNLYS